jgi:hypothetical protein
MPRKRDAASKNGNQGDISDDESTVDPSRLYHTGIDGERWNTRAGTLRFDVHGTIESGAIGNGRGVDRAVLYDPRTRTFRAL